MKSGFVTLLLLLFIFTAWTLQGPLLHAAVWSAEQAETSVLLDVPYVPTPPEVVKQMLNMAGVNSNDTLYDLGCGDGRIVVTAAKEMKVRRARGFDIDPQRIRESTESARAAGVSDRVSFERKDLFEVDLREATVVSLYLLPSINLKLRPKLLRELKPGSRIVSHDFDMGDWRADRSVQMNEHTVYFWVVPAVVNGTWKWTSESGRKERYELRLTQHFQEVEQAVFIADDIDRTITEMSLVGDTLEFTAQGDIDGLKGPVRFRGFVKGNTIEGAITSPNTSGVSRKWTARREPLSDAPIDTAAFEVALSEQK